MSQDFETTIPSAEMDQLDAAIAATPVRVKGADTEPGKYQAQFKGAETRFFPPKDGKASFSAVTLLFQIVGPPEALEENPIGNETRGFYPLGSEVGRSIFLERMQEMGITRRTLREILPALETLKETFWEIKVTHTQSKKNEGRVFQNIYISKQITD